MDIRLLIVLTPLVLAASWALFNIGTADLKQLQTFFNGRLKLLYIYHILNYNSTVSQIFSQLYL